jgi:predicted FMN-binding regulatory protein PaiB
MYMYILNKHIISHKSHQIVELVGKLYSRPLQEHTAKQNHQISSCSNVQDQLVIFICRAVYKEDVDNVKT